MSLYNPSCKRCPLHKTAHSVCVPGRGDSESKIMIVGQAPGKEEDKRNKCFIGPAGQLLFQAIKEYSLRPVWLTNAVKCFPPGDRDPMAPELNACREYLDAEIEEKKPEFVVALGNIALKALTGKTGITTWSGEVVAERNGHSVFALVHPAFILRYPQNLARFETDCKKLSYLLRPEAKPEEPKVEEIEPEDLSGFLKLWNFPVAWDLETTGKFHSAGGKIRTAAFSDGQIGVWMRYEGKEKRARKALIEFLRDPIEKIAHNAAFEIRWALDEFGIFPKNLKYDTMLMHYLVDENASHALDSVAAQFLGVPSWDAWPKMKENGWTYETAPIDFIGRYNALDAVWTRRLYTRLLVQTAPVRKIYFNLQLPLGKLCARLERRGVAIDDKWAKRVDSLYEHRANKKEVIFQSYPEVQKFRDVIIKEKKEFNMNSSQQMARLFYNILKLPVQEETDGGRPSVREAALKRLEQKSILVKIYLEWKSYQTLRNNFLQKFPKFRDESGLVHASFNPAQVVTGRLSVTSPPLQAVPEDPLVRGMIVSRFHRGKIAAFDYKQLEVRLVASESGEKKLIRAIEREEDLHSLTAKLVFGPNFTDRQRSIAKRINFGIVYGITAYTLAPEFGMSAQEAEKILVDFKRSYPAIYKWMRKQHHVVKRDGQIVSRFGRVRRLPELKDADHWREERILRQAGNFPIASAGADINNLAAVKVDAALRKGKFASMLVHSVHDSILADVHPREREKVIDLCVETMEKKIPQMCPWLKVPLKVDVKIADRWGGAEEIPKS